MARPVLRELRARQCRNDMHVEARSSPEWPVKEGAVTLGSVIVFKTQGASKNRSLFAHELQHVDQFRKLGIGGFARRYAEDPGSIEAEARATARLVTGRG